MDGDIGYTWDKHNKEMDRRKSRRPKKIKKIKRQPNFIAYNKNAKQISWCEETRRDPKNKKLLQVRCTNSECKKWFTPTKSQFSNRKSSLYGYMRGENRFYCSEECKTNCSIYNQQKYPKGEKPYYSRPDQKDWAAGVAENADYECEICGSTENCSAHHFEGLNVNPLMSADVDMGIYLCDICETRAHKDKGCRYIDLTKRALCS